LYLGDPFADDVTERYLEASKRDDPGLRDRARRLYELREFGGVRRAAAIGDDTEFADAVEKLRRSAILLQAG